MPNQSNDKINSFFEKDFNKIMEIEISSIKSSLCLQNYMQNTLLSISDKLWDTIKGSSDIILIHNISKDLYDLSIFSKQLHSNMNCLEKLQTKIETLILTINPIESNDIFFDKMELFHNEALVLIEQSLNFNSTFNDYITKFSKFDYMTSVNKSNESVVKENTETNIDKDNNNNNNNINNNNTNTTNNNNNISNDNNTNINNYNNNYNNENYIVEKKTEIVEKDKKDEIDQSNETKNVLYIPNNLKENTLIISDTEVILPFTKKDLEEKLETSNLSSCKEIIDTFYKKSAKSFEPSALSRFKEAYSLVVNKEHGSKLQAISLALELSTNYNLHPAIISACKDLTQLDVYLSCLEYKELSDFHFFDIVYNIPPAPKKRILKKIVQDV